MRPERATVSTRFDDAVRKREEAHGNMIFHGTETLTHVFCGRSPSGSNPKARRAHNRAATGSSAVIANNHGILKPMYTYTISAPNTKDDA